MDMKRYLLALSLIIILNVLKEEDDEDKEEEGVDFIPHTNFADPDEDVFFIRPYPFL